MGLNCNIVFVLVAVCALLPPRAAADLNSSLSPLLSPLGNGICEVVVCGKGKCQADSNHIFGFACVCNPGWRQTHLGDHFRFLPCIIPNCSINYSCTNTSKAPAPAPVPPPPTNLSIFDPCVCSYCGGGSCTRTSDYKHKCECNVGYSNLFNDSALPCFRDCSLGADCSSLGINLSNSTDHAASPSNLADNGSPAAAGDSSAPTNSMLLLFTLVISLAVAGLL